MSSYSLCIRFVMNTPCLFTLVQTIYIYSPCIVKLCLFTPALPSYVYSRLHCQVMPIVTPALPSYAYYRLYYQIMYIYTCIAKLCLVTPIYSQVMSIHACIVKLCIYTRALPSYVYLHLHCQVVSITHLSRRKFPALTTGRGVSGCGSERSQQAPN